MPGCYPRGSSDVRELLTTMGQGVSKLPTCSPKEHDMKEFMWRQRHGKLGRTRLEVGGVW